ncbi:MULTISPECIES: carbohydrate ABC transporter permease [Paenibacillus]|uniref:Sugar ABC transporter permease n=2 Tax=Paenibacillus TaxID=44249 RepID=A0AAJ2N392_9BACL|nr:MULTISPECIES: sugar ABC transporter permease [Paenibacillus]EPY12149.1 binding-protein-dependent transport systems inner membrane component [Paenibacillus alvei A6-6i-x]MCY9533183.1 sugar ABC transporter permease [Paenibacillus alvei]MDT8975645.1 sugar ABC transporter permease [Paenibacillus sp. chi10]SDF54092.1 multiple sugar transport system permease protein [Paenibacillus sp. cl6col]GAV13198.1 binding-protein-dependent transport systems inner membrane component [Paenibacillus sp. NAIST15
MEETKSSYQLPKQQAESGVKKFWSPRRKEALVGWLFLLPEIVGMLMLNVFALGFSLYLSFTDWDLLSGVSGIKFAGLQNFIHLFQDPTIWKALYNNLVYTVLTVPIPIALALVLAVVIHSKVYFKDYFKVVFFIPYISSIIAVAAVWSILFHPSLGPINQFLMDLGISNPPKWLVDPKTSLIAVAIISAWAGLGYTIIIYMAGLSNISEELYEAAEIDGATGLKKFFNITIPLLRPTTFFLLITMLIGSFKVFDIISYLTEGGPDNSSTVIVFRIYQEGFVNYNMGYASAISWLLFAIIGLITAATWKMRQEESF